MYKLSAKSPMKLRQCKCTLNRSDKENSVASFCRQVTACNLMKRWSSLKKWQNFGQFFGYGNILNFHLNSFKTLLFVVSILRCQRWFDADVLVFQIQLWWHSLFGNSFGYFLIIWVNIYPNLLVTLVEGFSVHFAEVNTAQVILKNTPKIYINS